jgi:hypothetical protein
MLLQVFQSDNIWKTKLLWEIYYGMSSGHKFSEQGTVGSVTGNFSNCEESIEILTSLGNQTVGL